MLGGGQVNSWFRVSDVFSYSSSSGGKVKTFVCLRGGNLGNMKERVVSDVRSQLTVYIVKFCIEEVHECITVVNRAEVWGTKAVCFTSCVG